MLRNLSYILLFLVLAALLSGSAHAQVLDPDHPYHTPDDRLLVIAHRGGSDLRPENTLLAFEHAVRLGVDVLEMDVHSTADDVLVVIHDATVSRTTNGTGYVRDYTFEELQQLDAAYYWTRSPDVSGTTDEPYPYRGQGITIPALEAVLTAFPDTVLSVEIKQLEPSIAGALCDMLHGHEMIDQVVISASNQAAITEFRIVCPGAYTAGSAGGLRQWLLLVLSDVLPPGSQQVSAYHIPQDYREVPSLTPYTIGVAHDAGIGLYVWTVNTQDEMQRLIEMGIDGIITDRPDLLLDLLGRLE